MFVEEPGRREEWQGRMGGRREGRDRVRESWKSLGVGSNGSGGEEG